MRDEYTDMGPQEQRFLRTWLRINGSHTTDKIAVSKLLTGQAIVAFVGCLYSDENTS